MATVRPKRAITLSRFVPLDLAACNLRRFHRKLAPNCRELEFKGWFKGLTLIWPVTIVGFLIKCFKLKVSLLKAQNAVMRSESSQWRKAWSVIGLSLDLIDGKRMTRTFPGAFSSGRAKRMVDLLIPCFSLVRRGLLKERAPEVARGRPEGRPIRLRQLKPQL